MTAAFRKYALIAFFALLVYFGYRPVQETVLSLRGATYVIGGIGCDDRGRTYRESEQRQADDGCNVCTCGAKGWLCTQRVCVGSARSGTIAGKLSAIAEEEGVRARLVCATNVEKNEDSYCQQTLDDAKEFAIAAKPGDYWVYAARVDDESGKRAYWSEYVKCGKRESCKNHSPVLVHVEAGQISQADPSDWDASVQIDLLNVTPSKWEYATHNYYPGSAFLVKGKGLASVRIFATPYPEQPGAAPKELGQATLTGETESVQTWTFLIPKGFQAWTAYAVGENQAGDTVQSYALRIIRPIDTTY